MSVLSYLTSLADEIKIQDAERTKIDTSISNLSYKIGQKISNISSRYVFGSYDRKTILKRGKDASSDVDFMVVFSDGKDFKPQTLMNRLKSFVTANYSMSEIYQSSPTIVLELSHIKFELVPAYTDWWSTYIPAPSSSYQDWMTSDPNKMKNDLNSKNSANYHLIRKLVRILKYWNVRNGRVYSSYELERQIVDTTFIFCYNLKDYFYAAVESLPTWNLTEYSRNKVNNLKNKCTEAKSNEANNMPATAEGKIAALFS